MAQVLLPSAVRATIAPPATTPTAAAMAGAASSSFTAVAAAGLAGTTPLKETVEFAEKHDRAGAMSPPLDAAFPRARSRTISFQAQADGALSANAPPSDRLASIRGAQVIRYGFCFILLLL